MVHQDCSKNRKKSAAKTKVLQQFISSMMWPLQSAAIRGHIMQLALLVPRRIAQPCAAARHGAAQLLILGLAVPLRC